MELSSQETSFRRIFTLISTVTRIGTIDVTDKRTKHWVPDVHRLENPTRFCFEQRSDGRPETTRNFVVEKRSRIVITSSLYEMKGLVDTGLFFDSVSVVHENLLEYKHTISFVFVHFCV